MTIMTIMNFDILENMTIMTIMNYDIFENMTIMTFQIMTHYDFFIFILKVYLHLNIIYYDNFKL
jgi:hypothetical protein